MKNILISGALAMAVASMLAMGTSVTRMAADDHDSGRFKFKPNTLVLSRSVYVGTVSMVTIGETLPRGCAGGPNGSTVVAVPTTTGGTTSVTVTCGIASDNGEAPNLSDSHNVWNNSGSDGRSAPDAPHNSEKNFWIARNHGFSAGYRLSGAEKG